MQYNSSQTHTCMNVSVYHCTVWFIVYICTYMYVSMSHCTVWFIFYICMYMYVSVKPLYCMVYCLYMYVHVCVCEPLYILWLDNKPYSTMVHRHIHVRTYIDNKPYSTMVHRHIHVRTYIDNKPYHTVQWFTETYMYVYIYK
jgi:hypothetical protein